MSKKFTPEQELAASVHGGSVLVSAAAGSGKTTVLVERVIRMLSDPEKRVPADRLLIVTFTRDAAANMREKLGRELTKRIIQSPDDLSLRRQKLLLQKATIGTIDSFCGACVREFFAAADVAPDFRIVDPEELKVVRSELLANILEENYAAPDEEFTALLDLVKNEKKNGSVNEMVMSLDSFVSSFPYPEDKIAEMSAMYAKPEKPGNTVWGRRLLLECALTADYITRRINKFAEKLANMYPEMYSVYAPILTSDTMAFDNVRRGTGDSWQQTYRAIDSLSFSALPKVSGDPPGKAEFKKFRDRVKKYPEKLKEIIGVTEEEFMLDTQRLYPAIRKLCDLTLEYRRQIDARKKEMRMLEYDDLEHITAQLLVNRRDGGFFRTDIAHELASRYDEILLDEYQDTNYTQDLIFRAISRETGEEIKDGENMFMVGDIKQSIYRFRKAAPQLFLDRLDRYAPYDRESEKFPAVITLDRNFRSRQQVTDTVNFFFDQLMTRERGGIEYASPEQRLVCGRVDFPDSDAMAAELHIIDGSKDDNGYREEGDSADMVEARYCARLIRRMIDDGFQVTDEYGMRCASYSDFCILRRSIKGHADVFVNQLAANGIPCTVSSGSGFFSEPEICVVMSLLRVIDNPLQDIPMLAALRSPIFGFDCDRLAQLRSGAERRKMSLYACINEAANNGEEDCARVLSAISAFRDLSAAMPSDRLISAVYRRTGYLAAVQASANGAACRANLLLLLDCARNYESSGYKGLSRFISMIDRLIEQGGDRDSADVAGDNCVTIRSMHKAKGLEFPVCIIAGLGGGENRTEYLDAVLTHNDLGIGMRLREADRRIIYTTAQREAVVAAKRQETTDEELRILYVAMTRPVDKLIMLCTSTDRSGLQSYASNASDMIMGGEVDAYAMGVSPSMGRWITAAAMRHPAGGELRRLAGESDVIVQPTDVPLVINVIRANNDLLRPLAPEELAQPEKSAPDAAAAAEIRSRLNYVYPYGQLHSVPSKVTASGTHAHGASSVAMTRPSFMQEHGLSAAERGTAMHRFMQFCDFDLAAASPENEAARLVAAGHLSQQEASAVDFRKVRAFFGGEMGRLIAGSIGKEREWRFTAMLEPRFLHYFTESAADGEKIVLEGECDLLLYTDDGAVIVDYKTDNRTPEELTQLYSPQLQLYASAVRQVTGVEKVSCCIYSFRHSQLVPISIE